MTPLIMTLPAVSAGFTRSLMACLAACLSVAAFAPAANAEDWAIENVEIHTGTGAVIESGSLLVRDGKIRALGERVRVPGKTRRIDGAGHVLTPGFIDSASKVSVVEVENGTRADDHRLSIEGTSAGFSVALGVNRFSSLIPIVRADGITHAVLRPSTGKYPVAGQAAVVDLSGSRSMIVKERAALFAYLGERGRGLSGNSRGFALARLLTLLDEARLYDDDRRAFRRGELDAGYGRADLEAAVRVLDREMPLAVYVDRAAEIERVLAALEPYDLDIVLVGAREAWRVADVIAAADVPVVINVMDNIPRSFDRMGARLDQAALLRAAGITVAFMSEDQFSDQRLLRQHAGIAVANGLAWEDALAAMTSAPAAIWGIEAGTLEKGAPATMVLWDGDPFELSTNVARLYIDGTEMSLETRQTQLRDRYIDPATRTGYLD